jgi:methionyl-tRNA formyltransferase
MNLLLFLNSDTHSATALSLLLSTLKNHKIKIILSKKVGNVEDLPRELIAMKKFEQDGVEELFARLVVKLNSEILSYENVNSQIALQDFQKFSPDLIISIRFGQIFKQALINLPRHGVINLHSGILPNYRGILATFWAILNGEKKIGMTLHFITDSRIDSGDIIGFSESEIDWNSSLFSNINKLYEGGCALLSRNIEKIFAGEKIAVKKQAECGEGKYFSYPKSEDVKKFLQRMPLF